MLHFGHANIIKYSNRPFADVDEMNESIVRTWNETVQPQDTAYILGDVSFIDADRTLRLIKRMNGTKILLWGNHDQVIRKSPAIQAEFKEIYDYLERDFRVADKKVKIVMCHYALRVWNRKHHGALHLYGHSHGTLPDDGSRSMDVGLDAVGMRPISLEEVFQRIGTRPLSDITRPTE